GPGGGGPGGNGRRQDEKRSHCGGREAAARAKAPRVRGGAVHPRPLRSVTGTVTARAYADSFDFAADADRAKASRQERQTYLSRKGSKSSYEPHSAQCALILRNTI